MDALDNFFEKIQEQIASAEEQACLNGIKANTIILNENHAYVKEFFIRIKGMVSSYKQVPPMILGKKLYLGPLPEDYDFSLTYVADTADPLESVMKKHVKLIGEGENEQLVFKGVSTKRNKKDFELIKRLLGL